MFGKDTRRVQAVRLEVVPQALERLKRGNTFINNLQRLKNHWTSRRVKFNEGVSEKSIAAFECQYGVVLPTDLRDFFLTVNGMPDDITDEEMIRFWRLEEVKPLSSEAREFAKPDYIENSQSLFVFADYSLWAHAYVIRLDGRKCDKNEIFLIGGDYPVLLFRSFSELVDSYLADPFRMFGMR